MRVDSFFGTKYVRCLGFNMTEIIIVMALAGLIAVFALPKVLDTMSTNQKNAALARTLSELHTIMEQGMITGALDSNGANVASYFLNNFNATTVCSTDSLTQGCWNGAIQGSNIVEEGEPGVVLPDGVDVVGFDNCCAGGGNGVMIDSNGQQGPNQIGQDQLWVALCFGTGNTCTTGLSTTNIGTPGQILPVITATSGGELTTAQSTANQNLFNILQVNSQ
jgi:prepilin-type N-terminal cleavage/methylation domain-containing protein